MSRDYHQNRRERWPLVSSLLALGFSCPETAQLIGWSAGAIGNDIKARGGMTKCFPDRPKKGERFAGIVQRLAEFWGTTPRVDSVEAKLFCALQEYFFVKLGLVDFAHGVAAGLRPFKRPQVHPGQEPYVALAAAVLRINLDDEPVPDLVDMVLRAIELGEYPVPVDLVELHRLIVHEAHRLLAEQEPCARWKAHDHELIDEVLVDLAPAQIEHLRRVFGLSGYEPMSVAKAGRLVYRGKSAATIHKNYHAALQRLRRIGPRQVIEDLWWVSAPHETRALRTSLVKARGTISDLEDVIRGLKARLSARVNPPKETQLDPDLIRQLIKPVGPLELSVRSYNCLSNHNIEYLFELVLRSEADMLRIKNLGRKSMYELREVLGELGLGFRMKVPEQVVNDLLAWKLLQEPFRFAYSEYFPNYQGSPDNHPGLTLSRLLSDVGIHTWADLVRHTEDELREILPAHMDKEIEVIKRALTDACEKLYIKRLEYVGVTVYKCTPLKLGQIPEWLLPLL